MFVRVWRFLVIESLWIWWPIFKHLFIKYSYITHNIVTHSGSLMSVMRTSYTARHSSLTWLGISMTFLVRLHKKSNMKRNSHFYIFIFLRHILNFTFCTRLLHRKRALIMICRVQYSYTSIFWKELCTLDIQG